MRSSIIVIVIGVLLWQVIPKLITNGSKKARQTIGLICNIVGILLIIAGAVSFFKALI